VNGLAKKRTASDATATSGLAAPAMKRQKSGDAASTPQPDDANSVNSSTPEVKNDLPANMMPPDFSQMQQQAGMNMPLMAGFNPMLMMQMAMNQGNGMNPMNFMNAMNPMMMSNGMNANIKNMGYPNQTQNQNWNVNMNMNQTKFPIQNFPQNNFNNNRFNNRPQNNFQKNNNFRNGNAQVNPPPNAPTQPAGLTNVPTGPKALQNKGPAQPQNQGGGNNNFYPPTGPGGGGKFSNQQRYAGNDEDNAYMRQPVNPGRSFRGKKMRDADFREL
jgi:hypothetical protein